MNSMTFKFKMITSMKTKTNLRGNYKINTKVCNINLLIFNKNLIFHLDLVPLLNDIDLADLQTNEELLGLLSGSWFKFSLLFEDTKVQLNQYQKVASGI